MTSRLHVPAERQADGRLKIVYDFSSSDQLEDGYINNFQYHNHNMAPVWIISDGKLYQMSNRTAPGVPGTCLAFKMQFIGDMEITATILPVDNDKFGFVICYKSLSQNYVIMANSNWGNKWDARCLKNGKKTMIWNTIRTYDPAKEVQFRFGRKGSDLYAFLDGDLVFSEKNTEMYSGSVGLACVGQVGIQFDSVVIQGYPSGRWGPDSLARNRRGAIGKYDIDMLTANLVNGVWSLFETEKHIAKRSFTKRAKR